MTVETKLTAGNTLLVEEQSVLQPEKKPKPQPEKKPKPQPEKKPKPQPEKKPKPQPEKKPKPQPEKKPKPQPEKKPNYTKLSYPPKLPRLAPKIKAPKKFKHPLTNSQNLIFMLGEDAKGFYLYGEGTIIEGAFDKFKRYVNHYNQQDIKLNRLMIHSPGGLVNEGLMIGGYIKQNNWATDSDKHMRCYSTCGLIFASGVKKYIQSGAEVGFHRPYEINQPDTPEFIEMVYEEYQPYWRYIEGSSALYDLFMKNYAREDMLILKADSIKKYMNVEIY